MSDFAARVQRKAEAHLAACNEALYEAEMVEAEGDLPESPSFAPYCGCDTCIVREVLLAVWDDFTVQARRDAHELGDAELAAPGEWGDRG